MFNSAISLMKGAKLEFANLLQTQQIQILKPFTTEGTSKSDKEKFPIFLTRSGMKRFSDKISFQDQVMKYMEVPNEKYYNGFDVDFDTMNDSQEYLNNLVKTYATGIAEDYSTEVDMYLNALLAANGTWIDSTAFFATSRPNLDTGSNTINNLVTGTLSSAYTYATITADVASAIALLAAMKDKNNKPYNPDTSDITFLIPSQHSNIAEYSFKDSMTLIYSTATQSNQYAGRVKIVTNNYQTNTDNDCYIINNKAAFKPIYFQNRQGIEWDNEEDKIAQQYRVWFTTRYGAKLLNPFSIVKINN